MKTTLANIAKGIASGVMISIGCAVYLACPDKNVGAVLFSVALLTICYFGFSLYTGKIGFIVLAHGKKEVSELLLGLLGNLLGVTLCGWALMAAIPSMKETALALCNAKLAGQAWWQTFARGCFCGILMYVAVAIFKEKKSPIGVLFAIPVFILSGFEHSIADIGYFAVSGIFSWQAFGFLWLVIAGNTVGAMILPALSLLWKEKNAEQ